MGVSSGVAASILAAAVSWSSSSSSAAASTTSSAVFPTVFPTVFPGSSVSVATAASRETPLSACRYTVTLAPRSVTRARNTPS